MFSKVKSIRICTSNCSQFSPINAKTTWSSTNEYENLGMSTISYHIHKSSIFFQTIPFFFALRGLLDCSWSTNEEYHLIKFLGQNSVLVSWGEGLPTSLTSYQWICQQTPRICQNDWFLDSVIWCSSVHRILVVFYAICGIENHQGWMTIRSARSTGDRFHRIISSCISLSSSLIMKLTGRIASTFVSDWFSCKSSRDFEPSIEKTS